MTARYAILPPEPVDDRATDPDMPPSGCRATIRPVPPLDEDGADNDSGGPAFASPAGRDQTLANGGGAATPIETVVRASARPSPSPGFHVAFTGEGAAEGDFAEAARADDGATFTFPCGCTEFEDCPECAPELWVGGRRLEE